MPHVRVVQTSPMDAVYINGTKVQEWSCIDVEGLVDALRETGMDIAYLDFCGVEVEDEDGYDRDFGDPLPMHLRDFPPDTVDEEDRLGKPGLLG